MRTGITRLPILTVLALGACGPAAPDPQSSEADASTVRAMVDQWIDSWNAGDANGLVSFYAADVVGLYPRGPNNIGRAAMRESFADGFEQFLGVQSATVDGVRVEGDVAFVHGSWMVTPPPSRAATAAADGDWMWVLERQPDAQWLIVRHISNETMPGL